MGQCMSAANAATDVLLGPQDGTQNIVSWPAQRAGLA